MENVYTPARKRGRKPKRTENSQDFKGASQESAPTASGCSRRETDETPPTYVHPRAMFINHREKKRNRGGGEEGRKMEGSKGSSC